MHCVLQDWTAALVLALKMLVTYIELSQAYCAWIRKMQLEVFLSHQNYFFFPNGLSLHCLNALILESIESFFAYFWEWIFL